MQKPKGTEDKLKKMQESGEDKMGYKALDRGSGVNQGIFSLPLKHIQCDAKRDISLNSPAVYIYCQRIMRNLHKVILALFALCFLSCYCMSESDAQEWSYPTGKGWLYPVDHPIQLANDWDGYTGHVGIDLDADEGNDVRAIADGHIKNFSSNLRWYADWNDKEKRGGAILVEHEAYDANGTTRVFFALYGHCFIQSEFAKRGSEVSAQ